MNASGERLTRQAQWRPFGTAAAIAAFMVAGCTAGVNRPESASNNNSGLTPAAQINCPAATLTNDNPQLREALRTAMADACAIFESATFRSRVESLELARKCPLLPFRKHQLIAGHDIYRGLAEGMPQAVSITAADVGWRSTIATTNASTRSITIKPWRFSGWMNGSRDERGGMINTLVHEMTHLVERSPGAGSYFQDGGQWTPWCNENLLVSYALGDAAEDQWRRAHP
jgi:hypothetical protein